MAHLDGKAIVITGAGRGIGAACALLAAAEGAAVVVNDIDGDHARATVAEIQARGGRALAVVADVTEARAASALIDACVDSFGKIDGLVNNAAVVGRGALLDLDPALLRRVLEINVVGVALCSAAAARHMASQGTGAIVNVSSGAQCGIANVGIYAASKGAVASFTYSWALEFAGTSVRVNGFVPGKTATRMMEGHVATRGGPSAAMEALPPEANAPPILFLLSDASAGVNGQMLRFDGRRVTLMSHPAIVIPWADVSAQGIGGIAEAFATDLTHRQMPLGIASVRLEPAEAIG